MLLLFHRHVLPCFFSQILIPRHSHFLKWNTALHWSFVVYLSIFPLQLMASTVDYGRRWRHILSFFRYCESLYQLMGRITQFISGLCLDPSLFNTVSSPALATLFSKEKQGKQSEEEEESPLAVWSWVGAIPWGPYCSTCKFRFAEK